MPTPDEIANQRFLVALRGYDRDQVHLFLTEVSRHVADLERQKAGLAEELDAARAQLAERGSETPSEPAHQASQPNAARPFAALGEETQRVLEAAQEAAGAITGKARQDADRQLQAARQATAKVIAEGERRRDQTEQEIAKLEERRAEVARELASVGLTIEQLVSGITSSNQTPTVREALTDSDSTGVGAARQGVRPGRKHLPSGHAVARELPTQKPDPPSDEGRSTPEVSGSAPVEEEPVAGQPVGEGPAAVEPAGVEAESASVESAEVEPASVESAEVESPEVEVEPASVESAPVDSAEVESARVGTPDVERQDEHAGRGPDHAEGPGTAAAGSEASDIGTAVDALASQAVDARRINGTEPGSSVEPDDGATALSLRAGALEPLHPKMMRRLKRRISDLQNIVLDRLRRSSGKGEAEALVPEGDELAVLAEVGEAFLDQAYEAGVEAAAVLAGRNLSSPSRYRSLEGDFANDGGERIRESVLMSLRVGFAGNEPLSVLNDRVGTVFSELKSTAADELSAIHLIRAYEYGLLDAWDAGGVRHRVWIPGRELRCPEGRCRQNDETGAVEVSQPFPSGHEVPPVHAGCTCTTIPALEP